jgi:hypothetical protein
LLKECHICKGEKWVCENHADKAWGDGDGCPCGGAGMECICTVGGYFGQMRTLYDGAYRKLGINPPNFEYKG